MNDDDNAVLNKNAQNALLRRNKTRPFSEAPEHCQWTQKRTWTSSCTEKVKHFVETNCVALRTTTFTLKFHVVLFCSLSEFKAATTPNTGTNAAAESTTPAAETATTIDDEDEYEDEEDFEIVLDSTKASEINK